MSLSSVSSWYIFISLFITQRADLWPLVMGHWDSQKLRCYRKLMCSDYWTQPHTLCSPSMLWQHKAQYQQGPTHSGARFCYHSPLTTSLAQQKGSGRDEERHGLFYRALSFIQHLFIYLLFLSKYLSISFSSSLPPFLLSSFSLSFLMLYLEQSICDIYNGKLIAPPLFAVNHVFGWNGC